MKVGEQHFRTIWLKPGNEQVVQLIDQRFLPHRFVIEEVNTVDQMATAIREMHVRGAGLIGASAGYGMYLGAIEAAKSDSFDQYLTGAAARLAATRPTAVNLMWAVQRVRAGLAAGAQLTAQEKIEQARRTAEQIADEDAEHCRMIGRHGLNLIKQIAQTKGGTPVNILTHCNAGWLAFVDYGSALAPVYAAHDAGLPVHVWVDETRPRNQGSKLTAWELGQHGVPHTIIADNAGGHLMQGGAVDLVIVGSDRTTCTGDVANKIGTYLKALAAQDNKIPFYVALPSSSFDWTTRNGSEIPIEQRGAEEIKHADGWHEGQAVEVRVAPEESPAANYGFDVTPRRLVTGLITERGICKAEEESIRELFPEHAETGSVKFTCEQSAMKLPEFAGFAELNAYRRKLIDAGLIGVDANGIGFGNLSVRDGGTTRFYITGSATGGISELMPADYARVVAYDFKKNWIQCEGFTIASSESLTHAAVYESDPTVFAVIHCHDMALWRALLDQAPTTRKGLYGTPEMAYEVRRLFADTELKSRKIFAMASHEGGVVSFGKDLEEAFNALRADHRPQTTDHGPLTSDL